MTLPTDSVAWLLGLEGIALLRALAGDVDDEAFIDQRLAEAARILAAHGDPDPAGRSPVQPVDTRTGYDLWAPTYDSEHNPLLAAEQAAVWPWLNQLPPGLAVDAACGTGRYASLLAAHGHTVVGIDSSPGMLAIARHKVPTARLLLGDLTALPVADHAADLVICALALTHQPTLGPALKEFARILRRAASSSCPTFTSPRSTWAASSMSAHPRASCWSCPRPASWPATTSRPRSRPASTRWTAPSPAGAWSRAKAAAWREAGAPPPQQPPTATPRCHRLAL